MFNEKILMDLSPDAETKYLLSEDIVTESIRSIFMIIEKLNLIIDHCEPDEDEKALVLLVDEIS